MISPLAMRILLSLLVLAFFLPLPAQAYLTPEEVLSEEDFVAPPPNARNARAAREAQEAEYDARAEDAAADEGEPDAGEDDWTAGDEEEPPSGTLDDLHGAAGEEEVIDWEPDDTGATADERRDERVLERIERTRLEQQGRDPAPAILHGAAPDETLHGGAPKQPPLAGTGPGTVVLLLAGSLAVGFTLRLALKAAIRA